MLTKEFLVFVISISVVYTANLKITVYYESLCPYSRDFIANQLSPTYDQFANELDIDLIPYGNAMTVNTTGQLSFTCQHGPSECYGNKAHACALGLSSSNSNAAIEFIICSMSATDPSTDNTLQACAGQSNIPWSSIQECLNNGRGDELLAFNGVRTDSAVPRIKGVPDIRFNDVYDETLEARARNNLPELACELIPGVCNGV